MGFKGNFNNADGRVPEFGAIFMSNTASKRECFQRRLFGLPSSLSKFVKQVKAGMILFLFEYDKRQLHGVFEASSDGAMDIVSHAFSSSGKQFPAQVKFIPIWYCKPLPESIFCDAIRENYFSAKKFNFGLSEKQVLRLLNLFSLRKLELELPGRQLIRLKDAKHDSYPVDKVGRPSDGGIQTRDDKNDRDMGGNNLPPISRKYRGDYVRCEGEPNDIGLNGSDMVGKKLTCVAKHGLDTTIGNSGDYFSSKDECRFTRRNKEYPYIRISVRETTSGGCPHSPTAKAEAYDRFPKSDKLMSENKGKRDQRMACSDNNSGFNQSKLVSSVFGSKLNLETDPFVKDQPRSIPHPIQSGVSNGAPDLYRWWSPFVRTFHNCDSMQKSASPSNNYWRSNIHPLNNQPPHLELEDINRHHENNYITANDVTFGAVGHHKFLSAGHRIPSDVAQISKMLAPESVAYEDHNSFHFFKYSSVPLPSSDVFGNGDRRLEPFPSMFHKYNSPTYNDVQPLELQENLGHKSCSPVVSGAIGMHYGDPLINEYDLEYCGDIQSPNFSFPKEKGSVFSRLSFKQDIDKQENGNNTSHVKYDGYASVEEVMEVARGRYSQWTKKGKLESLVEHDDAEILRDKRQINSSRLRKSCLAENLKEKNMKISAASEETTDQIVEEVPFVDFKRRSQVKKINDQAKRGSQENGISEDLVLSRKKKRKLIRPNFSESKSSDDMGINDDIAQNLQVSLLQESSVPKDANESCNAFVGNEDNIKADIDPLNLSRQTNYEDKSGHARECIIDEEGTTSIGGCISNVGIQDDLECPENFNQNALSSSSLKEKSKHIVEGLCTDAIIKSPSPNIQLLDSVSGMHHGDKDTCAGVAINIKGGMYDGGEVLTGEVDNENAPIPASCEPGRNTERSCLKHLTVYHESESTNLSVVSKESSENEHTEEISGKVQEDFSTSRNVDKPYQYLMETAVARRELDSRNRNFKLMGANICVVDGEGGGKK